MKGVSVVDPHRQPRPATGEVSLRRSVSRGAIEFATMARDGDRFLLAWQSRDAGIVRARVVFHPEWRRLGCAGL
jgi:hypothetical protein